MGTMSVSRTVRPAAGQTAAAGAYAALLAFFVVYCARPEDWIHPLAVVPLAKITGALAVAALLMTLGSGQRRLPREMLYFTLLAAQLWLTVPFSTVWKGGAFWQTLAFSKLLVILPVMLIAAGTLPRLRQLIFVQAGSATVVALVSIVYFRLGHAERMTGAANGEYGNPNDLAMALSIALPFCFAFLIRGRGVFRKTAWSLAILIMVYSVFLTQSRAGLLSVALSMGACLWEFGIRGGRRYLLVLAGIAGIVVVILAGKGLKTRFAGAFGSDLSTREGEQAYESALERREMLKDSIIITLQHPLFGIGPGNFTSTTKHWRETHNNYTQMSCEGGIPALILFLIILWSAFANLRATRKRAPKGSEEALWAGALNASLLGFVVASLFASVAYLFFPYFLVAYTSILRGVVSTPQGSGAEPVPQKQAPRSNADLFRLGRASSLTGV